MFLKIKRGEKLLSNNTEPYMNASNDEYKMLAYVYQTPGTSKQQSSLLSNERIYNLIFGNSYNTNFFVSIQRLKISFSTGKNILKRRNAFIKQVYLSNTAIIFFML